MSSTTTTTTKSTKSKTSRHAFCSRSHDTFALTQEVVVVEEEEKEDGEDSTATAATTMTTTVVVPVPVPHENILWHLLVSAERSWAHANELSKLKTTSNNNNKSNIGRQPVLKKLKRANKWSTLLVEKAKTSADDETQRECEAYAAWMSANYALEKMDYQVCIVCCVLCCVVCVSKNGLLLRQKRMNINSKNIHLCSNKDEIFFSFIYSFYN